VSTHEEAIAAPPDAARISAKALGLLALGAAVVLFSLGSTLVRKAGIPGPTVAFWRMLVSALLWWAILWVTERRFLNMADIRRALVPGIVFGLNIMFFFTAVTYTSVANVEFIGALTPIILVPAGALLFKEHINGRALWFGLISFAGLMLVLFNAPPRGVATWKGNSICVGAMFSWATYLLTSRRLRATMSIQTILAAIMTIATVTILPITLVRGELDDVTMHSVPYILLLSAMSGTVAHGLMVYAQHTVPIGTIGMLQVAQPALAAVWAYMLLDQGIRPIQVIGMALVLIGLTAVITLTRRSQPD
jgi:drug/metabolite transporter (DMT)-like permease